MDALEFFKARKRMCEATKCASCKLCHMQGGCSIAPENEEIDACKEAIAIVEQWAAAHPVKTRQSVFLEQYPDANISDDGLPDVAPCQLCVGLIHGKSTEDCENRGLCKDCRREFWMQEVEE